MAKPTSFIRVVVLITAHPFLLPILFLSVSAHMRAPTRKRPCRQEVMDRLGAGVKGGCELPNAGPLKELHTRNC